MKESIAIVEKVTCGLHVLRIVVRNRTYAIFIQSVDCRAGVRHDDRGVSSNDELTLLFEQLMHADEQRHLPYW